MQASDKVTKLGGSPVKKLCFILCRLTKRIHIPRPRLRYFICGQSPTLPTARPPYPKSTSSCCALRARKAGCLLPFAAPPRLPLMRELAKPKVLTEGEKQHPHPADAYALPAAPMACPVSDGLFSFQQRKEKRKRNAARNRWFLDLL